MADDTPKSTRVARQFWLLVVIVAALVVVMVWQRGTRFTDREAATWAALEQADSWTLMSIQPAPAFFPESETDPRPTLDGYPIIGQAAVTDADLRATLLAALTKGVADKTNDSIAACFNPRHAIRAEADGRVIELLICFECAQIRLYHDGERVDTFLTTGSPADTFNDALVSLGIPLPPSRDEADQTMLAPADGAASDSESVDTAPTDWTKAIYIPPATDDSTAE